MPSAGQAMVLAGPIFLLLLLLEAWMLRKRADAFNIGDTLSSLGLGLLSRLVLFLPAALSWSILDLVYQHLGFALLTPFWQSALGWAAAFVFYDFCYYWHHRIGHERTLFWAAHSVHHQSQYYNLSTALRQPGSYFLLAWIFYLPMALLGISAEQILIVGLINLLYQFWIHTEAIGSLGWFDRWFASPSNHRVHHGVNDAYIDKNYGGFFMLWDHLFGTFQPELKEEMTVYGTRSPLNTWSPLKAHTQVLQSMLKDAWQTQRWCDKLRIWVARTGWRPSDCPPYPAFDIGAVQRYAPPASRLKEWLCLAWFALSVCLGMLLLWYDRQWPFWLHAVGFVALFAQFYLIAKVLDGSVRPALAAMVALGFIAMLSATIEAQLDLQAAFEWELLAHLPWAIIHAVSKSLALLLIIINLFQARKHKANWAFFAFFAAVFFSWVGDVVLLRPEWFTFGLGAFALAHVAYWVRLQSDSRWFASKWALGAYALCALAMLVWLWSSGLPATMRLPVLIYCILITAMVAQAAGRAVELKTPAARWVAFGAFLFVFSDVLIAYDRFIQPLAFAPAWILSLYFTAQGLLIHHLWPPKTLDSSSD